MDISIIDKLMKNNEARSESGSDLPEKQPRLVREEHCLIFWLTEQLTNIVPSSKVHNLPGPKDGVEREGIDRYVRWGSRLLIKKPIYMAKILKISGMYLSRPE
jgi:hypothetical protein